jgi:N-acetylglutamate synthase-like GNAT family acetyltransferase
VRDVAYRQAAVEDAAEIHELLLRLASEIPIAVDTLEREEALYTLIRRCARGGESWVAVDAENRIVGAVLVELNQRGRHYAENEILDLRHAAVTPECGEAGILDDLLARVTARMLPVAAGISPHNRSGLAACLERLGFADDGTAAGARRLRWQPGRRR